MTTPPDIWPPPPTNNAVPETPEQRKRRNVILRRYQMGRLSLLLIALGLSLVMLGCIEMGYFAAKLIVAILLIFSILLLLDMPRRERAELDLVRSEGPNSS